MKRLVFTLSLLISASGVFAQSSVSPYLFPTFSKASVLQKGGGVTDADMNYNTLTQEMLFIQNGDKLVMDLAETVDTIFIQGKKFIPVGKVYYDKITETKVALYQQHFNKMLYHGKSFDWDNQVNSALTASQGVKLAKSETSPTKYVEKFGEGYALESLDVFWLQKGKSFYSADGVKKIVKVFPDKEQAINDYIKANNLNISKADDLAKLIVFCNK